MIQLIIENVYTRVQASQIEESIIWEALSFENKGREFAMRRLRERGIKTKLPKKKSGYEKRWKRFLTGNLQMVTAYLSQRSVAYNLVDKRIFEPVTGDWNLYQAELRDYQIEAVRAVLRARRGILNAGTGGGKTFMSAAIIKAIARPTLFLVNRAHLLYQTAREFEKVLPEAKGHIGIIGDGQFDQKIITLATVQTLYAAVKKHPKAVKESLSHFKVLIIDEAHRASADQFVKSAALLENCVFRIGLTGTAFINNDPEADMRVRGVLGPIAYRISASELVRRGVLARPFFKYYPIREPDMNGYKHYRDIYEQGIIHNTYRNAVIVNQTKQLAAMNKKPLVVCSEIAHVENLTNGLQAQGLNVGVATGSVDTFERKRMLDRLDNGNHDCIVASTIFDEGVDLPNIAAVVNAAGLKSPYALLQRTGRAIRKKEDDNWAIIIDFIDLHHRTLTRHSAERIHIVQSEPEFKIIDEKTLTLIPESYMIEIRDK
jgi:superfamily II DNA or RNA helicase